MISNTEKSSQILKEEIQRLEEQGISGHILEELMEFRREMIRAMRQKNAASVRRSRFSEKRFWKWRSRLC